MLNSLMTYGGIRSKIKAMMGRNLKKEQYFELMNEKSVPDLTAYLKNNTIYREILNGVNVNEIHRSELEALLYTEFFNEFERINNFFAGDTKPFLNYMFFKYEKEAIKINLRRLNINNPKDYTGSEVSIYDFMLKHSKIDFGKLEKTNSYSEMIDRLKGSVYYKALYPIMASGQKVNMFTLSTAIDTFYLTEVWKSKDKYLKGEDNDCVTQTMGTEIDLLNAMWILRGKLYYKLPREILLSHVIPINYKLSTGIIRKMAEVDDERQILELLQETCYGNVFKKYKGMYYEICLKEYVTLLHHKNMVRTNFNIGSVVAYLHLKETELSNIISIIEGIRYGLSEYEIKQNLVYRFHHGTAK